MVSDVVIAVIIVIFCVAIIIVVTYLTRNKGANPVNDDESSDPDSEAIAISMDFSIYDEGTKRTIKPTLGHPSTPDSQGFFEALYEGEGGKLQADSSKFWIPVTYDLIFHGDVVAHHFPNGLAEGLGREAVRTKQQLEKANEYISYLETNAAENGVDIEERIQQEFEKSGARTRAKSPQGQRQFDIDYSKIKKKKKAKQSSDSSDDSSDQDSGEWDS